MTALSVARQKEIYRAFGLLSLGVGLFAAVPFGSSVVQATNAAASSLAILSDWRIPVIRSLLLMALFSPACIVLGFVLGAMIVDSGVKMKASAAVLLIPLLLGSAASAFAFKLWLMDVGPIASAVRDRNQAVFWLLVLAMLAWQYVPFVCYICWWTCSNVAGNQRSFASAHKMAFVERLRDIYWPECRNVSIYLLVLVASATAAEYGRSALVFRASQGTETEFFSHWLARSYFSISRLDPDLASKAVLVYAFAFVLVGVLVTGAAVLLLLAAWPLVLRLVATRLKPFQSSPGRFVLPALIVAVFLPLYPAGLRAVDYLRHSGEGAGLGVMACVPTLMPPAIWVAVGCALLSVVARLGWPDLLQTFGRLNLSLCLSIAAAGFLPPIALAFVGMWWLGLLRETGLPVANAVLPTWWLMLSIGALPIFVPGFLSSQFVVRTNELRFQEDHRASFYEVFLYSFLTRLWPVYALFAVFAFATMWSEFPLTALFSGLSTRLCSPVLELAARTEGKGAEYGEAALIVWQMMIPVAVCVGGLSLLTGLRRRADGSL